MAQKPESALQRRIQVALRKRYPGCYVRKIHVSEFQSGGIADLVCCINGRFAAVEVKRPGEQPSRLQCLEADEVRRAGGIAITATSPDDAIRQLDRALASVT